MCVVMWDVSHTQTLTHMISVLVCDGMRWQPDGPYLISSSILSGVTDPPYRMRIAPATSSP